MTRSTMTKAEDNDGSPGEQRQDDDQGRWGRVMNNETMTVPTCTLHRVGGATVYVELQSGGAKLCRRRRLRARPMHRQGGLCGTCLQGSRAADFCTTSDQARIGPAYISRFSFIGLPRLRRRNLGTCMAASV